MKTCGHGEVTARQKGVAGCWIKVTGTREQGASHEQSIGPNRGSANVARGRNTEVECNNNFEKKGTFSKNAQVFRSGDRNRKQFSLKSYIVPVIEEHVPFS